MALAIGEFSTAALDLSDSGFGNGLSQYLASLSGVEKKARDLQHDQAEEDSITFVGTGESAELVDFESLARYFIVEEYARAINSVRV